MTKDDEFSIQARLKEIHEGFDDENYYYEDCDVCGGERRFYTNKYDSDFVVRVCVDCDDGWECEGRPSGQSVCPFCDELVCFEEGDKDMNDYAICAEDDCGQMVHISCLADEYSNSNIIDAVKISKKWLCERHFDWRIMFNELRRVMEIPGFKLYRILKRKEVHYIYHANTVRTACAFIENRGLLSRGYVEDISAEQTPQKSDEQDKKMGIWYDVFFDSVDIHHRLSLCTNKGEGINLYGPVLFKYKIEALLEIDILSKLKITRTNPIRWNDETGCTDFYTDLSDVSRDFRIGQFGQHIVIHDWRKPLPFTHLDEIILDDPGITDEDTGVEFFSQAVGGLRRAKRTGKVNFTEGLRRECQPDCICSTKYRDKYNEDREKFDEFFIP